jgi:hypothetical protein
LLTFGLIIVEIEHMSPSVIYKVPTLSMRMIPFKEHLNMQPKKINKIKIDYLNQNGKIHNNTGNVSQNQTHHTSCHR